MPELPNNTRRTLITSLLLSLETRLPTLLWWIQSPKGTTPTISLTITIWVTSKKVPPGHWDTAEADLRIRAMMKSQLLDCDPRVRISTLDQTWPSHPTWFLQLTPETHLWRSVMKDSSSRQRQVLREKGKIESYRLRLMIIGMNQECKQFLHWDPNLLQRIPTWELLTTKETRQQEQVTTQDQPQVSWMQDPLNLRESIKNHLSKIHTSALLTTPEATSAMLDLQTLSDQLIPALWSHPALQMVWDTQLTI